jgi:hypothetical protein
VNPTHLVNEMIVFANKTLLLHTPLARRLYLGDNIACIADKHLRQTMIAFLVLGTDEQIMKGFPDDYVPASR